MIIKKITIENFKSIKHFDICLNQDFVNINDYINNTINNSNVKMWKTHFIEAVKWGLGVNFDFGSMLELLHQESFANLENGASDIETNIVKIEFSNDEQTYILAKYTCYKYEEEKVQFDKVWFTLNDKELKISEHIEFCAKFYNSAFAYVSFIEDFDYNMNESLSLQLWQERFINLLYVLDLQEEKQEINKVAKNFKIAKKQLHLALDDDLIPQWYKPKGGLYLDGDYSQSESILRFIYYRLALNEYISKKYSRNLPIFLGEALNKLDSEQQDELFRTLNKMNKQKIRCE